HPRVPQQSSGLQHLDVAENQTMTALALRIGSLLGAGILFCASDSGTYAGESHGASAACNRNGARCTRNTTARSSRGGPVDDGGLPLAFEQNVGQTDPEAEFLSRGPGYTLFLTAGGGAVIALAGQTRDSGGPGTPRHLQAMDS